MLEFIILYFCCKNIGEKLRKKGWRPLFMQIAVVVAWIGAAVVGALAYEVFCAIRANDPAVVVNTPTTYIIAVLSGASGVGFLFIVAAVLPNRMQRSTPAKEEPNQTLEPTAPSGRGSS